jgi:hypothetical protein
MVEVVPPVEKEWSVPINELISLLRQGTVQGSKSTAITPLTWALAIMMAGLVGGLKTGLPDSVIYVLCGCLVLLVLGLLGAYAYFARNNPDALRTERYTLTKLAIERRLRGDDVVGITEAIETIGDALSGTTTPLPTPDSKPGKSRTKKLEKTSEGYAP